MSDSSPTRSPLWPGVPLALASAILFGASAPFAKLLLGSSDPQLLAGLLYLGAGIGLAICQAGRSALGLGASEAPLRRTDLPWLAAIVLIGGVMGPLFLLLGLARTSATSGSLLLNLEGLATMAIAWVVFRESVDRKLLLGAVAILAGAIVLSWHGQGVRMDTGGLLIAAACLAWGIDNNLTRKLSSADPVVIALIKGLVAGCTNLALALLLGKRLPSLGVTGAALVVGVFGVGVSLVLFVLALRHLGSARTGAYFSLAPFLGAVIAVVLLREPVTPQLVVAGALMAFGLWLHLTERHEHEHTHEAIEHEHRHVHDGHHRHAHNGPVMEPHTHLHRHEGLRHQHVHYPDLHHRHEHGVDLTH
jgi:drug/metabolite transporter (DMT)-like permease